jgi:ABC-type spermidine/putrescine transport system permease subunit II
VTGTEHERSRRRQPGSRSRRPVVRTVLVAALALLAFLLGIAFARTLDDRPTQGPEVTTVGTLPPVVAPETVTVTVTSP